MHPTIYREFHIGLAPTVETRELARGQMHDEPVMYVKLHHIKTSQEAVFKLVGDAGTPERWIEEQVMRQFPDSDSALERRLRRSSSCRMRFAPRWRAILA